MRKLSSKLKSSLFGSVNFLRHNRAATGTSYMMVVGLIAVIAIGAVDGVGRNVGNMLSDVGDVMQGTGTATADALSVSCPAGGVLIGLDDGSPVCNTIDALLAHSTSTGADSLINAASGAAFSGKETDPNVASVATDGDLRADEISFNDNTSGLSETDIQGAIDALDAVVDTLNAGSGSVAWSGITGLPSGFSDGTDDGITTLQAGTGISITGSGTSRTVSVSGSGGGQIMLTYPNTSVTCNSMCSAISRTCNRAGYFSGSTFYGYTQYCQYGAQSIGGTSGAFCVCN